MKKQTKKPIIGILGGMGPQSSACLLDLLINMAIERFGVKSDNFPEILLDSVSVSDFISNVKNKDIALEVLKKENCLFE